MTRSMSLSSFQQNVDQICHSETFDRYRAEVELKNLFNQFKRSVAPIKHKDQLIEAAQEIFDRTMSQLDAIAKRHEEKKQPINPGDKV